MNRNLLLTIIAFFAVNTVFCEEEFECPRSRGYFPHPRECKKYYSCRKRVSTLRECPERMLFDEKRGNCYIQSAVDCGNRTKPTVTVVTMTEIREDHKVTTEIEWNTRTHKVTEINESSTQENVESSAEFTHKVTDKLIEDNDINSTTTLPEKEFSTTEIVEEMSSSVVTTSSQGISSNGDDHSTTASNLYNTDTLSVSEYKTNDGSSNKSELDVVTVASKEPHLEINKTLVTTTYKPEIIKTGGTTLGVSTTAEQFTDGDSIMEETSILTSHRSEHPTQSTDDNQEPTTAYSTKYQDISRSSESHFTTQESLEYSNHTYKETTGSTLQDLTTYDVSKSGTSSNGGNEDSESTRGTSIMEETSKLSSHQSELPTKSTDDNQEPTTQKTEDITRTSESDLTTQESLEYSSHKDSTVTTSQDLTTYDVSKLDKSSNGENQDSESTRGTGIMEETSKLSSHQSELPTKSTDDNQEPTTAYSTVIEDITRTSESHLTTQESLEYNSHIYKETTGYTLPDLTTYDVSKLDTSSNAGNSSQEAFTTKVTEEYYTATLSNKSNSSTTEQLQTSEGTITNISTTLSNEQTNVANGTITTTVTSFPKSTQSNQSSRVTTDKTAVVTEEPDDYTPDDFECPTAYGRYPHPTDKHKFLHCQEWFPHIMTCPADLVFDPKSEICVWPRTFIMH